MYPGGRDGDAKPGVASPVALGRVRWPCAHLDPKAVWIEKENSPVARLVAILLRWEMDLCPEQSVHVWWLCRAYFLAWRAAAPTEALD
jgi:hypothetical protein